MRERRAKNAGIMELLRERETEIYADKRRQRSITCMTSVREQKEEIQVAKNISEIESG